MTVTIHRRDCTIEGTHGIAAWWIDGAFEPLEAEERQHEGFRHRYRPIPPVQVQAPAGSRLVDREIGGRAVRRLAYHRDTWGIDAESVYWLARHEDKGFSMAGKRKADGPSLFGETDSGPGPYGFHHRDTEVTEKKEPVRSGGSPLCDSVSSVVKNPSVLPARDELARIAAQAVAEHKSDLVERLKAYEDRIRRAIAVLTDAIQLDDPNRMVTARAILEGALDWSPADSAQARSA